MTKGKKSAVPKSIKTYVKRAIDSNTEDKFFQTTLSSAVGAIGGVLSTGWNEYEFINQIAQGLGIASRVGRSIRIKSLLITGILSGGAAETANDDSFNIIRAVVAKYANGAGTTPLSTAGVSMDTVIQKNYLVKDIQGKYMDKYIPIPVASNARSTGVGYAAGLKPFRFFKRFKNFKVTFGSDATSLPSHRLAMSFISDSGAVEHPAFERGYAVLTYEDA